MSAAANSSHGDSPAISANTSPAMEIIGTKYTEILTKKVMSISEELIPIGDEWTTESHETIENWFLSEDKLLLIIFANDKLLDASLKIPDPSDLDAVYFVRTSFHSVSIQNFHTSVIFGKITGDIDESLFTIIESLYVPDFLTTLQTNDECHGKVYSVFHKCLSYITDLKSERLGIPILYIPSKSVGFDILIGNNTSSHIIRMYEYLANIWIFTIRASLSTKCPESNDKLITDEYEYYELLYEKLEAIEVQVKQPNFMDLHSKLNTLNSYLSNLLSDLITDVKDKALECKSIKAYLFLLLQPCVELNTLKSPELYPIQLLKIMQFIKYIYLQSPYFQNNENLIHLFLLLTNQLITNFQTIINLDQIFSERTFEECIEFAKKSIDCCNYYQLIYEKIFEDILYNARYVADRAFVQMREILKRFEDLIEICRYIKVYSNDDFAQFSGICEGSGTRDVYNNVFDFYFQKYNMIRRTYGAMLPRMRCETVKVLDISIKNWSAMFMRLKGMMHLLDQMVLDLITTVFAQNINVEEGIGILYLLHKYYARESIQSAYLRNVSFVWKLFDYEIRSVIKKPVNGIDAHLTIIPKHSYKLICYAENLRRLARTAAVLESVKWLPETKQGNQTKRHYWTVVNKINEMVESAYMEWRNGINNEHLKTMTKRSLMQKFRSHNEFLRCNVDSCMFDICENAFYFIFMGRAVPPSVMQLYNKYNVIKLVHVKITKMVIDYNRMQMSLSTLDQTLLSPFLVDLEQRIRQGIFKVTWEDEAIEMFIKECYKKSEEIRMVLKVYRGTHMHLIKSCQRIANLKVYQFSQNGSNKTMKYLLSNLNDNRAAATEQIQIQYDNIRQGMVSIYAALERHISRLRDPWIIFVSKIDKLLKETLMICLRKTVEDLYHIFHGKGFGPASLFEVMAFCETKLITVDPTLAEIEHFLSVVASTTIEITANIKRLTTKYDILAQRASDTPYYKIIQADRIYQTYSANISNEMILVRKLFDEWLVDWNNFLDSNCTIQKHLTLELAKDKPSSVIIGESIAELDSLSRKVAFTIANTQIHFFTVNSTSLNCTIVNEVKTFKTTILSTLKAKSVKQIEGVYEYIQVNSKLLANRPTDTDEVESSILLQNTLIEDAKQVEKNFPELKLYFDLLDEYEVLVLPETRTLLGELDKRWEAYLHEFTAAESMLEETRLKIKNELMLEVSQLNTEVINLRAVFDKLPKSSSIASEIALEDIRGVEDELESNLKKEDVLLNKLKQIQFAIPPSEEFINLKNDLILLKSAWLLVDQWKAAWAEYKTCSVASADTIKMEFFSDDMLLEIKKISKNKIAENWDVLSATRKVIIEFNRTLPLLKALNNPALKSRHWAQYKAIVGKDFDETSDDFNLEAIIAMNFQTYFDNIIDISQAASQELQIEGSLKNIEATWNSMIIEFLALQGGLWRIVSVDDCFVALEDNIAQIMTMKGTRYGEPFMDQIDYWEKTLSNIQETLELALSVQQLWLYLRNIFQGDDIRKQLAAVNAELSVATEQWRDLMNLMRKGKNIVCSTQCVRPNYALDQLNNLREQLEGIQRSLEVYLEKKRQLFPRFYFISNDDLLEMLGNSAKPDLVQKHLHKVFDSLSKCELKNVKTSAAMSRWEVHGMYSGDGEYVKLLNVMRITGPTEVWLRDIESQMRRVLKDKIFGCTKSLIEDNDPQNLKNWLLKWPAQLCLTALKIQWTMSCTKTLKVCGYLESNKPFRKMYKRQCAILRSLSDLCRQPLAQQMRQKVNASITLQIHGRDVIQRLYQFNCQNISHFEWFSQLRFYWDREHSDCAIRQTNTLNWYNYEYLGNSARLVITPLTDRCYITLTTALHMYLGGNPKGPAGTGKTETVKDLGKAIGIWVLVNNCSESLDYKSMETILSGLSQCGIWGCFDEFNRINIEVLSVVAQRIHLIFSALAQKLNVFLFDNQMINLVSSVGLFITMNPGYAGRTELPDNLKSMFRPIAMVSPDNIIIAENLLFSEGFRKSKLLANKVVTLFNLAKQKLSFKSHYDFGLRSMVSQLRYASTKYRELPKEDEEGILLMAMIDMNGAKLTAEDAILFNDILSDIFPGIPKPSVDYGEHIKYINEELQAKNLQNVPSIMRKVLELFETKNSRHSVMILGASGAAKSTIWKILQGLHARMKGVGKTGWTNVNVYPINPKTLSTGELYGEYHNGEWSDGVVSSIMRRTCTESSEQLHWILFDGPVDAIWIEDMNSVMDDNKVLTLINREHITLSPKVSLLFEAEDLNVASPATVSRCGIIYSDFKDLGWRPYVQSWIKRQKNTRINEHYAKFFDYILDNVLLHKRKNCKEAIQTSEMNQVESMCHLIQCISMQNENGALLAKFNDIELETVTKLIFFFAMVWTVCGCVDEMGRMTMDKYVRETHSVFPLNGTIYDYYVDIKQKSFMSWSNQLIAQYTYDENTPFYKIVIPTADTIKYKYLISNFLLTDRPVLVNGMVGCGKTLNVQTVLDEHKDDKYVSAMFNMSSRTTVKYIQEAIESRTEKRTKEIYAPPGNKKLICFMDDFNMPAKQEYGAQPALELIRHWIDYGFWFNRQKQIKMYVKGLLILAAMGPAGGARQTVSSRILGKFYQLNITFPQESVIKEIFGSLLKRHLLDFEKDIQALVTPITEATIQLYNNVQKKLLPTITKIHYLFNLRDISRVFGGLCRCHSEHNRAKESVLRLWLHECYRVFSDRINDHSDYEWFSNKLGDILNINFGMPFQNLCPKEKPLIFADFVNSKCYDDITDNNRLAEVILNYLNEFNSTPGWVPMNIVMFREAFEHVCRISRVISQSKGHILLIGIGGSGRRSLAKLAAYIRDYVVFQIRISQHYGITDFREDMKTLYKSTGINNKPVLFLFSDTQAVNEEFFEVLNNMLSVGEVPNLFKPDEWQDIRTSLEQAATKAGISPTNAEAVGDFFLDRAKTNLFIAICVSPNGDDFRNRLRQYPALLNCCTIDWLREWPETALLEIAKTYLEKCDISARGEVDITDEKYISTDQLRILIAESFAAIHQSVIKASDMLFVMLGRHNYVTPSSYIELVSRYQCILENRRVDNTKESNKLRGGLDKIDDTRRKVEEMSEKLRINQRELGEFERQCDEFMTEIQEQKASADKQKAQVFEQSKKVAFEEKECQRQADSAQEDLSKAMPALNAAAEALNALNKKDLTEVKSYATPPPVVEKVMEAVMILQGRSPTWAEAKKQLGDSNFLDHLKTFDKNHIPDKILKKLAQYTADPGLEPTKVGLVSTACKSLCIWFRAIENYAYIYKVVGPKIALYNEAKLSLELKQAQLVEAQAKLNELAKQIAALQLKYEEKVRYKEELMQKSIKLKQQLDRAMILVDSLAGAKQRWTEVVAQLDLDFTFLPGNCVLSAAFLSYLGPFTSEFRDTMLKEWRGIIDNKKIPLSTSFTISNFLSNPTTLREWLINGLPSDGFSEENALIVTLSTRWPLIIDPQGQAQRWIKNMEAKNKLKIIDMNGKGITKIIEQAVINGTPILMQNIGEHFDAALNPIINKELVGDGNRLMMKWEEKLLNYNQHFKFYITTKLSNPHYLPEITTKTTLINFVIKEEGLENQLLGIVVCHERPELEELKDELVVRIAKNKRLLSELENEILRLLNESQVPVIEDEELFDTLQTSNKTSVDVSESLSKAEITELEIDEARNVYRPCAIRASILFFVLLDLSRIDSMYQFSLVAYTELFLQSIVKSIHSPNIEKRIATLNDYHTYSFYSNTCRGLFERHKLLFSFHMCRKLLQADDNFVATEYDFFVRGGIVLDRSKQVENPSPTWITDEHWDNITELDKMCGFHGIVEDVTENHKKWLEWYSASEPEAIPLVGNWDKTCSQFQKILIIRCFRRDRIMYCIRLFIAFNIGSRFIEPPILNIKDALNESSTKIPIFFILSPGADPAANLIQMSNEMGMGDRFHMISLGQGQAQLAEKLIDDGIREGFWVFLANCNLSMSWMPALDKLIETLQYTTVSESFRLWLSSSPSSDFPASILQYCIKITTEPPQGIKANLKRLYESVSEEKYCKCQNMIYRKLFFSLCFFHAVILERRQFQQLGWNICYSFNDSDFEISNTLLSLYLDEYRKETPWSALKYLIADINYGGHITDEWDRRLLKAYINQYFTESVVVERKPLLSVLNIYYVPEEDDFNNCKQYIDLLPTFDAPEAFGCNSNAAISSQIEQSQLFFNSLLMLEVMRTSVNDTKSENKFKDLVIDLSSKIPNQVNLDDLSALIGAKKTPYDVVLLQEIARYNGLLQSLVSGLNRLFKAIDGYEVMSFELESIANSITDGQVPRPWLKVYLSMKLLGSWIRDLIQRVEYFTEWADTKHEPNFFWLGAFTFPTSFLTAVLQTHSRLQQVSIDQLSWNFSVLVDEAHYQEYLDYSVLINGLYLEGAGWNQKDHCLQDPLPMELIRKLPILIFEPSKNTRRKTSQIYECPVYYTPERAISYVTSIDLNVGSKKSDVWVKVGAAILLNLAN